MNLPIGQSNLLLDDVSELEFPLLWVVKPCVCGARITYGKDTVLHSYWCDAYEDKYAKTYNNETD